MSYLPAVHPGPTSADVIADILRVHFSDRADRQITKALDLTYGEGGFWNELGLSKVEELHTNDLYKPADYHEDFTDTGFYDNEFGIVFFDPPFSAIGTPSDDRGEWSGAYGAARNAGGPKDIGEVQRLLKLGIREACRLARRAVIVKTQDVIESGKLWRSTRIADAVLERYGFPAEGKGDVIYAKWGRMPHPEGRNQKHAHGQPAVYLVGRKA